MFGKSKIQDRPKPLERKLGVSELGILELKEKLANKISIYILRVRNLRDKFKDGTGGFLQSLVHLRKGELRDTFTHRDRATAELCAHLTQ